MDKSLQESKVIFDNLSLADIKTEVIFNNETFWLIQIG